jgi:hypothetical protein
MRNFHLPYTESCSSSRNAELERNARAIGGQVQVFDCASIQEFETTINVTNNEPERESTQPVPGVTRPHTTTMVGALGADADDDLRLVDKRNQLADFLRIELVIAVHLENPRAMRCGESAPKRRTVAAIAAVRDDLRTGVRRFLRRTIGGSIVDHNDVYSVREPFAGSTSSRHRISYVAFLIEGGQHDRKALEPMMFRHTQHQPEGGGIT